MNEPEIRRHIDVILEQHINEEDVRFTALSAEIKELRQDIKDLTAAWQQAKGVLSFMKWLLGVAGGLTVFFTFMKDHWK